MQNLSVTIIQSDLHWQNTLANLAMFEEKLWEIDEATDLIILPEMFTTGFSMDAAALAEPMNFTTFKWLKQLAGQTKAVIIGSYIVKEGEKFFNRLLCMYPDGEYVVYDKRHLFRMAGEDASFSEGSENVTINVKGWKIRPFICYDLRFPVWSRNRHDKDTGSLEYDLAVYIANWPAPRVNAWDTLLQARAIENQSYVVGVNRIGEDGNGHQYLGHSAIIDPKGRQLFFNEKEEVAKTLALDWESMQRYREKFPIHLDADDFKIM